MDYVDFEVHFRPIGADRFLATVESSPAGTGDTCLQLPSNVESLARWGWEGLSRMAADAGRSSRHVTPLGSESGVPSPAQSALDPRTQADSFTIDEDRIAAEARLDGKWVLRTNAEPPAAEVAVKYKQLWTVEDIIRYKKSLFESRPVFHKRDETIRGHVVCSYLALVLRKELQDRLEARGHPDVEWAQALSDLESLQEIEIFHQGKRFALRTETLGAAGKLLQAAGVSLLPTVRQLTPEPR